MTADALYCFADEPVQTVAEKMGEIMAAVGGDGFLIRNPFHNSNRRYIYEITDGLVPHPVKVQRMERLLEIVQRRARERAERFVGRTLEVLVEGPSRTDPDPICGRAFAPRQDSGILRIVGNSLEPMNGRKYGSPLLLDDAALDHTSGRRGEHRVDHRG